MEDPIKQDCELRKLVDHYRDMAHDLLSAEAGTHILSWRIVSWRG